jgi:hypothetical protein
MISEQAMKALTFVNGIDLCKDTDPGFWRSVVVRIIYDMDTEESTGGGNQDLILGILRDLWERMPDMPVRKATTASEELAARVTAGHPDRTGLLRSVRVDLNGSRQVTMPAQRLSSCDTVCAGITDS